MCLRDGSSLQDMFKLSVIYAPLLEELVVRSGTKIDNDRLFGGEAPRLRSLNLGSPGSRLEGGLLRGLQRLELEEWHSLKPADFRDTLEGCRGLKKLICRDLHLNDASTNFQPVLMWSLQHLEVFGHLKAVSLTLAHILGPQCTHLDIRVTPETTVDVCVVSLAYSTLRMPEILESILLIEQKRSMDAGSIQIHCGRAHIVIQTADAVRPRFNLQIESPSMEKFLRWVRDMLVPALPKHNFSLCISGYSHSPWTRIANVIHDLHFLHGLEVQSHPDSNAIIQALSAPLTGCGPSTFVWPLPKLRQIKLRDCDSLDPETLVRMIEARYATETPAGSVVNLQTLVLCWVQMNEFALKSIRETLGRHKVVWEGLLTGGLQ